MSIQHRWGFSLPLPYLVVVFLAAGAFWRGLYTPLQQVLAAAVLGGMTLRLLATAPTPIWPQVSRAEAAGVLLLAAGGLLSLLQPAAAGVAAHGPMVMAGWFLAGILGRRLAALPRAPQVLGRGLALTGFLMTAAGLALLPLLPAHHSGRMASLLGYPVAVGMLGLMGALAALPDQAAGRRWGALLVGGNALGFWLSGSRGVWAAAVPAVLWILMTRRALLRRAWLPALLALVVALWLGPLVAGEGWSWLSATGWLTGRLQLTDSSTLERAVFFRDGLAIIRDLPLGGGYRSWTALHLQQASYGYYAAEVHSALLDHAVAFGWMGGAGFVVILFSFFRRFGAGAGARWESHRLALLAGLGALALHSLVDWLLSYGFFATLLWLGFGLAGPTAAPALSRTRRSLRLVPWVPAALCALTLTGGILVGTADLSLQAGRSAAAAGNWAATVRRARLAATIAPWDDAAHALLGRGTLASGRAEEALNHLNRARNLNPYEPLYTQWQAQALRAAGRYREAAWAYRELVRLRPWHLPTYETALAGQMDLARTLTQRGDHAALAETREAARAVLAQLERQRRAEPPWAPRGQIQMETPLLRQARGFFEKAEPGRR